MVVREEYTQGVLDESSVDSDPVAQFSLWFEQALKSGVPEPTAMILATVSVEGRPSVRAVLLKGHDPSGFFFATNYRSRKAVELEKNPNAALIFYWASLQRQIRIEGKAKRVSDMESDQYFKSRPRGAQIGAWASAQSQVLTNRAELETAVSTIATKFEGQDVPRPTHWGGFRLVPECFEFWQGRESRLHDRILYKLDSSQVWKIQRLAP